MSIRKIPKPPKSKIAKPKKLRSVSNFKRQSRPLTRTTKDITQHKKVVI